MNTFRVSLSNISSVKIILKNFSLVFKLKVFVIFISNTIIQPSTMMIEPGCTFITKTAMYRILSNHTITNLALIISVEILNKICILTLTVSLRSLRQKNILKIFPDNMILCRFFLEIFFSSILIKNVIITRIGCSSPSLGYNHPNNQ